MNNHLRVSGARAIGIRGLSVLAVLLALLIAPRSFAATITVNVSGAPQSNKCSLTDAVQAAITNKAVHFCPAGSSSSTDTIQLAANVVYQNYGQVIHVPSTGGTLVIQGKQVNNNYSTIRAPNYGYPSPNPVGSGTCGYPAAIFSGGSNLTIKDLDLQSSVDGTAGICQYAGSLTLNNVVVGDPVGTYSFRRGGVRSQPNNSSNHLILKLTDTFFWFNSSPDGGSGVYAGGSDVTMSGGGFENNKGGGMAWGGTGNLTLSGVEFLYNEGVVLGGGLKLNLADLNTKVTISHCNFQRNTAAQQGGAIYIEYAPGANQVSISNGTFIYGNYAPYDYQQSSLSSEWPTYDTVYCTGSSTIYDMHGYEWDWATPPLRGDGTCTFP